LKTVLVLTFLFFSSCAQVTSTYEKKTQRLPSSRGFVSSCADAVKKFFNRSRGREYSFSRYSNARAELDRIVTENNLNFPQLIERGQLIEKMQELNYLNSAEEKVALFDKLFPLSNFTRIDDLSSLGTAQKDEMNEILRKLESWNFSEGSGVNRLELDDYITHLALMGRSNPKGILAFWYKVYGNPKDIVNKWYLDTIYRDGVSGALGKFYQGRTASTMGADFKSKGLRMIGLSFKSIVSLAAVALDIIPIGNLNRVNISPEKLSDWMSRPYHEVEEEILRELRLTANIQLSKNLVSRILVISGTMTMGYMTYKHFSQDTFEHNSTLLEFEVQMMANEIARFMAKENRFRDEIIAQLLPEERDDATMVQTAKDIWIENKAKEIADNWNHSDIKNEWNRYMREQGQ
jgi:hypothetical protein